MRIPLVVKQKINNKDVKNRKMISTRKMEKNLNIHGRQAKHKGRF